MARMIGFPRTCSAATIYCTFVLLLLLYFATQHTPVKQQIAAIYDSASQGGDILDEVLNSTLGFQKIFVINLSSRTDLRDAVALAASFTGLEVDFIDGVVGGDISNKSLPTGGEEAHLGPGELGNWRSHINVARMIVEQNIQSALVLENDADWDIRIHEQMRQFARASRLLLQPLKDTENTFLDPTNPDPQSSAETISFDIDDYDQENPTVAPTSSPYGDLHRWDLLWLGHCGCRFPWASDGNVPLGRAVISNDSTVPEQQHIDIELGDHGLTTEYLEHTRVVSRARVNSCTLGHAFSQQGARKWLYELGVKELDGPTDMMFRSMCQGSSGRPLATCLTVQPQLFQHHRPRGLKSKESDIGDHGDDFNEHSFTANVRWSTRINFPKLAAGQTDYFDLYPDGAMTTVWAD